MVDGVYFMFLITGCGQVTCFDHGIGKVNDSKQGLNTFAQYGLLSCVLMLYHEKNVASLLVRMQNGTAPSEDSWAVSYKTNHTLTI